MDEHDLVVAVKNLALELGRTPTRREFLSAKAASDYALTKFGGFTALVQAAGLQTYDDRRAGKAKAIGNEVFQKDVVKHLEEYEPKPVIHRDPWPIIACISDVHRPFQSERVIARFIEYVGDEKPDNVIELGDGRDFLAFSRFPRSHNGFTPKEENALARKQHEEFWAEIRRVSPKSRCVVTVGNHCVRPLRRTLEVLPAAEHWIEEALKREFTFDGVETFLDPREEIRIGSIILHHGHRSKLGDHRDFYRENVIVGHTHKGGVVWRTMANGETIFEMNCGYGAEPLSQGLSYTPQKIVEWTPGFGAVTKYGPLFVSV